jgi:resuscitation-promoting factor RpfB
VRKIIPAVAAGVTALAVAGATFGYVTLDKAVALSIDGDTRQVQTMEPTVGELLEKQGIEVGERDVVVPSPDTRLAEGSAIAVSYGRLVTVTVDGAEQQIWTTATSVDRAIDELGVDTTGADVEPGLDTAVGRDGIAVDIATAKTVTIVAAGKKRNVTTTAQTVAGALTAAKIKVDGNDKLSVRPTAKLINGTSVRYVRVTESKVTRKVSVAYKTVRKETSKLDKGDTRVDTRGVKGVRTLTYKVVRHDGKAVSKKRTSDKVTKKPVTQVVLVGTKVEPKKQPRRDSGGSSSSSDDSGSSSTPSASVASGSVWDRLAQCESGGNWSINTGNGYYGGLQFSLSTWRAYGGSGYPHQNSRAQQIAIGQKLQAAAGWGQWPACSAKLGLR